MNILIETPRSIRVLNFSNDPVMFRNCISDLHIYQAIKYRERERGRERNTEYDPMIDIHQNLIWIITTYK